MARPDLDELVARARSGEHRAVARLLSLVENGTAGARDGDLPRLTAALLPHAGRAHVVGLTGPPGVGKSTTTSVLVRALRAAGRRVGVLAVDPSSPYSGGALLGDRVRMGEHATDEGVFIRSMAARGQLGGLARATPQALRVLDAAGCDVVLLETVGVGQSEIDVVGLADTTVVLLAPGAGDGAAEGVTDHALHAEGRVDADLGGDLVRGADAQRPAVADVRALGALADDDEVDVARLRQGGRHARVETSRPQVDVVVELEAQPQQEPPLEHTARHARVTDGAEQDRVVPADLGQHAVGQRLAGRVPALGAEVVVGGLDGGDAVDRGTQHLQALGDDLGTDAVAADDGETDGLLRHET